MGLILDHVRRQPVAYAALFLALTGTGVAASSVVTGSDVQDGSISSVDIKNGSLTGADIKFGTLDNTDIGNSTITGTDVRAGTLSGRDLRNGSVAGIDVDDDALTGADVRDGTVRSPDVGDGSLLARDFRAGELPATEPRPYAFVGADGKVDRVRSRLLTSRGIRRARKGIYCVLAGRGYVPRAITVTGVRSRPPQIVSVVPFPRVARDKRCGRSRIHAIVTVQNLKGKTADGAFVIAFDR